MKTVILWCRMYPSLAAWITLEALNSLAFVAGATNSVAVLRFFSGGLLTQWAKHHSVLSSIIAVVGPVLLLKWLAKLTISVLGVQDRWPSADKVERTAIQRALYRVPIFKAFIGLFAILVLVAWPIDRLHAAYLSTLFKQVPCILLFVFYLLLNLRGVKKPEPDREQLQAQI